MSEQIRNAILDAVIKANDDFMSSPSNPYYKSMGIEQVIKVIKSVDLTKINIPIL